jgi:CubicO group peptidase (beta-lactamase class C family)
MKKRHIPSLSLAVVKDGKLIKVKGYALTNVETNTPAAPKTVYKIGSISKSFLAAGVALLAQDKELGLDDWISKHLDGIPDSWKDITVRHLLTHTFGLVEDLPGFDPFAMRPDAEVVRSAYQRSLFFAAGD